MTIRVLVRLTAPAVGVALGAVAILASSQVAATLDERGVARGSFGADEYMLVLGVALVIASLVAGFWAIVSPGTEAPPGDAGPPAPLAPDPDEPDLVVRADTSPSVVEAGDATAPVPASALAILGLIGCFALYALMTDYVGYISGSVVFFLLTGRIMGVSWKGAIALAVLGTAALHLVFGEALTVPFPRTPFV